MPNILDIRRRIRSVINTRQITKAMKVVSAAKLRRCAGARAGGSSLCADVDECSEVAGGTRGHLRSGDGRAEASFAGAAAREQYPADRRYRRQRAWQAPSTRTLRKLPRGSCNRSRGKISTSKRSAAKGATSCAGAIRRRKCRRKSLAELVESIDAEPETGERSAETQITGEHVGILGKVEFAQASALGESVIAPLLPRRNRRGVHRLQRIQVGDCAAPDRRAASSHRAVSGNRPCVCPRR